MTPPVPVPDDDPPGRILRARRVVPVSAPPIDDGAVEVRAGRILRVGRWADLAVGSRRDSVDDLGEAVLLPGLVNAHAHLDYTGLAGQIAPTRSFPDWIKSILAAKSAWSDADFAESWRAGARQMLATGTTAVANIESMPGLVSGLRAATPLRVHSFVEITGVRSRRDPGVMLGEALGFVDAWRAGGAGEGRLAPGGAGLSPHAPYSTLPALLAMLPAAARGRGCAMTMHVAESREEFDMFMYRRGAMHDWLRGQRPDDDCGHGSPVQLVARHGLLGPGFIAVHVNYLWDGDARLLGTAGAHVAHCPRSHSYFRHQRFPAAELAGAGVNLCLGTDSLASTRPGPDGQPPVLSVLDEMASYLAHDSTVSPAEVLAMATVNGARALGLGCGVGTLAPGVPADLCAVPDVASIQDAHEVVAGHRGEVLATWIGGEPVWRGPGAPVLHGPGDLA